MENKCHDVCLFNRLIFRIMLNGVEFSFVLFTPISFTIIILPLPNTFSFPENFSQHTNPDNGNFPLRCLRMRISNLAQLFAPYVFLLGIRILSNLNSLFTKSVYIHFTLGLLILLYWILFTSYFRIFRMKEKVLLKSNTTKTFCFIFNFSVSN